MNTLYYGKSEPLPKQHILRAGPLSLIYDAGDLRYVKFGDQEVLRRVYVAVRDHNWDTVLPTISNEEITAAENSFQITFDVENKAQGVEFFWKGTISGAADGTVTYLMEGEAGSAFRRNRIGICVLHPMACAGTVCHIEHVNGTVSVSPFPEHISPQLKIDGTIKPVAPFCEMRAISYPVQPGLRAEIRLTGDIFEMEDQRNWTDASYKTYGTPLRLPFPVEVGQGSKIDQALTLSLKGDGPQSAPTQSDTELTFSVYSTSAGKLPQLGLGIPESAQPLTETELARLKALSLSHLRVDLKLFDPEYPEILRRATRDADALGVRLEVALILSEAAEAELQALSTLLPDIKPSIWAWLVFQQAEPTAGERLVQIARNLLASYDQSAKFGAGTNIYFTDLNRDRPSVRGLDLVSYSINPQVHAFDNASLTETLEAQAETVKSARYFCDDVPIIVSPITLKARFNPNATGPEPEPWPGQLPAQVDERQTSLFGAGWTVGSLKYLSETEAKSLTYYETVGWRGVMERDNGSSLPGKFLSLPGAVFPLYHVLADVGEFAGGEVLLSRSSHPLLVDGFAIRKAEKTRILLANLSQQNQALSIHNLDQQVYVHQLDVSNVEAAMRSPETFRAEKAVLYQTTGGILQLNLLPYAILRIDN